MDRNVVIVIIAGIIGLLALIAFLRYRQRGKADIKAPFGFRAIIEGSNTSSKPGVSAKRIKSRKGGVKAEDSTGRGIEANKIDAQKDVILSSSLHTQNDPVYPPTNSQSASALSARSLNAGGDITIQQFVGGQAPLADQLEFFAKQLGLQGMRDTKYADEQFKAYCKAWKILQSLRLAGNDLWEKASKENLLKFADAYRQTEIILRKGEIFFEDDDRDKLSEVLAAFSRFKIGKQKLVWMRTEDEIDNAAYADFNKESTRINRQIQMNGIYKKQYDELLETIGDSFKSRLKNRP